MRLALVLALAPLAAPAAQDAQVPLRDRVIEHRLDNGWRFLLLPRDSSPTVSFETWVAAGAGDDPAARSGMANLVKNLLFKGSDRLGTLDWEAEAPALAAVDAAHAEWSAALQGGDAQAIAGARTHFENARQRAAELVDSEAFSRLLEDVGGGSTLNAFADLDGTRFVVSLPSNQIEVWCWMEAERFRRPVFREFYAERDALLEDGLSRVVEDPAGRMGRAVRETAFGEHPLGRLAFGDAEQIGSIDRGAAYAFFEGRYGARQLTTAIVGDFEPARLIPLLERYFESVPAGPARVASLPPVPRQEGERRVQVLFEGEPLVWIAWHVPPSAHPDSAAVELAVRLLGYARSSRLERNLIRENALVSELAVNPAWGGSRSASLVLLRCVPNLGVATEAVEAAVYAEIQRLATEGPTREELAGVKRVAAADHYRGLRSNADVAAGLAGTFGRTGDWRSFFATERRLSAVSGADVQRVLRTYFTEEGRVVATLVQSRTEASEAAEGEE